MLAISLLILPILTVGCSANASRNTSDYPVFEDLTALETASRMGLGINIGNTLEAPDGEGSWLQPVNETYIKGLKKLGFTTVRVPCAWNSHVVDTAANMIDPKWLDRVDEVIGWILKNDMFAILNIHWDGGWLETNTAKPYDVVIDKKQHDYWTQIADKLNHHDSRLLLAAMNEPWSGDDLEGAANIIKYEQTFIDAVRATGGNNARRCLVIQAPATNIDFAIDPRYRHNLPVDSMPDKLLMEVHFYNPSDFTILCKDGEWGPGTRMRYFFGERNLVEGSERNVLNYSEADIAADFEKMKTHYVDHGIPVIVGEYSGTTRVIGRHQDKHEASRSYWNEVVTREARNHGCVPCYWEAGGDINRADGTARNQYAIDGIMRGFSTSQYLF